MNHWIDRRRSGVLLHISSLPGPFSRGVLGCEAREFVDTIADAGFTVWQFLPLGPTHGHGSPYESLSSFAGNPEFLDLRDCVKRGWLSEECCQSVIDGRLAPEKARSKAADGFWSHVAEDSELAKVVDSFLIQNADWLDDYTLFTALKNDFIDLPWWEWPEPLRDRSASALDSAKSEHTTFIRQIQFEQFLFAYQWQQLKQYAEELGMLLFGDLPIYVAHDSADVWANRDFFTVNENGLCEEVAGVPPDYFSENGQRWGNPLYRWDKMQEDGFMWWVNRVKRQLTRMHLLRIDHFRGLESFWSIPGDMQDGRIGEWRPALGTELLTALQKELGKLPLIAEDLGIITPEVTELREKFGLPGMKILQFAFGGDATNPYLPHNHELQSVAYTGTHDNDTTQGWYDALPDDVKKHIGDYMGTKKNMPWPVIQSLFASVARLSILPAQDILLLPGEARFNTPGTIEGNWDWRLDDLESIQKMTGKFQKLHELYNR